MKRSLVLSLCAVILATIGLATAQADVDVALNLTYSDPADPNDGGTWTLVAKTDDPNSTGITALVARFQDIAAAGTVHASIGHDILSGLLGVATFGSDIEFTYGQDPNGSTPGIVANVGLTGGPSDQGTDPLDVQGFGPGDWNNASVIATGSFGALRPVAVTAAGNETVSGTISPWTLDVLRVRGDSLNTLNLEDPNGATGLLAGDTDRDNDVDIADLGTLALGLSVGNGGWGDGDTNGNGVIDITDLGALALSLSISPGTPAAITGVPEPSTVLLAMFGLTSLAWRRRLHKLE